MNRSETLTRRSLLATIGGGSLVSLAGCNGVLTGDPRVELLHVGVINWAPVATAFQLEIRLDGEIVETITEDLEPDGEGRSLECTWPADPGEYSVRARLGPGDEWSERDLTDPDHDCVAIWMMIEEPGPSISIPISRDCEFYRDRC